MPSTQKVLQTRTFFFAYTWLSLPRSLSFVGNIPHLFPRSAACAEGVLSISGTLARALSLPSVTGPVDSLITVPTSQGFPKCLFQRNKMAALSYSPCRGEIGTRNFHSLNGNDGQVGGLMKRSGVGYSCSKGLDNCRRVSGSLKNREPWGKNMVYRHFWSSANGLSCKSNSLVDSEIRDFHSSCSSQYSAGAAPDVSFDGVARDEQLENHGVSSDLKILGDRSLKLLSGSCYLPHPDKEETGGEDAHFICVNEQAIGVADGVGGWADIGVNAGLYARELMTNSVNAIQEEPQGSIDPARVLEKAYSSTKARGSSTACIIALTDQGIHAVNLGDSGFIVVREGCTIFRSPVQQHDFNFTFQLESGNGSDLPSSAQVFSFPVASGDVIIAGTDGLFDNLYNNEVTAVVVHATRAGLGPQVTAQKIAALARQRAQDRNRQTPFSSAAQDAGYRYYGGKLDDITVVVSFITESSA